MSPRIQKYTVRYLFMVAALTALSACSVSDLEKPIETFATATRDAEAALSDLNQEVTSAYGEILRQRAVDGDVFVAFPTGDCQVGSPRCRIELKNRDGTTQLATPEPALREMIALMSGIRSYADSLSTIVTADSAAKVQTNVNSTIGNVVKLSETVRSLGGADTGSSINLAEYATPAGELVNWILGNYIAKLKLDGLRRATENSEGVVRAAAEIFGDTADVISAVPRAALAETVSKRLEAFVQNSNDQNYNLLIESAAAYDQLLVSKPSNMFARLDAAHSALVKKIHDKNVSLAEVVARIESFAAEAKTLTNILKRLTEARAEQKN